MLALAPVDPAAPTEAPAPTEAADVPAAGCMAGGLPRLPDAANVQAIIGIISYTTSASVADATAFYEQQAAALGGSVSATMPVTDVMAMLNAQVGSDTVLVTIAGAGGVTSVTLTSASGSALLPPTC